MHNPLRIVFMGTPDFAVGVLKLLIEKGFQVVGVVTVPDKPAGRGQQLRGSAVKKYAVEKKIPILQPEKLRDEIFLQQLHSLNADIFVVVAFRMLPEAVWNMPKYGTFNLHASLLPQYRGAAPINWAIINGETETGVTTFFLDHDIDTGCIIFNEKTTIRKEENVEQLHDRLMTIGAELVIKTLEAIASGNVVPKPQLPTEHLHSAPKIHKETCRIDWNKNAEEIHNLVRGLSPHPTAFTELKGKDGNIQLKIFETKPEKQSHSLQPGAIESDNKSYLKIACNDGFVQLYDLQLAGKKRMSIKDFLVGFRDNITVA